MYGVLAPDQIIHRVCEEIAYNKGRIRFKGLWDIIGSFFELKNDRIKQFIVNCLLSNPDIELQRDGKSVPHLAYAATLEQEGHLYFTITEDKLWTILTGYRKKESAIGGLAFELLMEIAKGKDHGVNTMDLAAITKQDPRSITGRIKKLGNLVSGVQIIYKGHVVKLLKFHKFADEQPKRLYVNVRQYLPVMVSTVKKSKNGVRQVVDLKRELKLDKDKRLNKAFIAAIAWLDEKKYLKKVIVVSPSNPETKIRCVQYLRDYIPEEKDIIDCENDSADEDEEDQSNGDSKTVLEDEDAIEGFDSGNATGLLQEPNLLIQENTECRKEFSMNRFFPLQNQTYALSEKHGTQGISIMECVNSIVGNDYKRSFTKNSEYYLQTIGKGKQKCGLNLGYELVRVYDFEGKKKFYRLFTAKKFREFTDASDPNLDVVLPPEKIQRNSLTKLSKESFMPLNTTLRFTERDGQDVFFWHGELDIPATSNTTARGRKRKLGSESREESTKKRAVDTPEVEISAPENDSVNVSNGGNTESSVVDTLVNIGGFAAHSLKSIQRQKAILDIVKIYGGVTYVRDQLYEDVSNYMGTKMILDKKTLRGDVELLVATNKLRVKVKSNGRRILYLPAVDNEAIAKYITSTKDTKVAFSKDIIKNTDIYFFDQTEHNRFHRGTKSAERITAFQNRAKKGHKATKIVGAPRKTKPKSSRGKEQVSIDIHNGATADAIEKKGVGHKKRSQQSKNSSNETFNVSTKEGAKALIMAAVITKSIKGQTLWPEISALFPSNSLEHLKKQWTLRRVKMGHSGWRALMEKWRNVMVDAVKNERATLEDAEHLNLIKLIKLWLADDDARSKQPVKLYKNYEENYKRYTLVKNNEKSNTHSSLAMSSMIQRESYLLKKIYTYGDQSELPYNKTEEQIRSVVRSILITSSGMETEDIDILKTFDQEQVDKVILDMARERHISFVGSSKLRLTDYVLDILDLKSRHWELEKSGKFCRKIMELLNAKKAVVVGEEPSKYSATVLIDMLESNKLCVTPVPLPFKENSMYYATRKYEVTALTPPLVFFAKKKIVEQNHNKHPIPLNKAFSRLWIDSQGSIREKVWKQLVFMTVYEILFNPGITLQSLTRRFRKIVSQNEIEDIVVWLKKLGYLSDIKHGGYVLEHGWYLVLG
ncbi:transcription factor TFIIIC subunit TFC3 Ecym_6176 [Eremothecium cymbalariae DBVPG|uniref:Uncharacterized protein n=1 Tax=Eremothecium cymbalariae (strain CBS 270.75 / DBVPG 7215 / KCTC 17166 / NRRL Y-17582) TaxID=931890 RepID=G8JV80_ERECY|nr:hypothetical protein Ecym_6176 [Eremothecium cymbalariae DBVPG\